MNSKNVVTAWMRQVWLIVLLGLSSLYMHGVMAAEVVVAVCSNFIVPARTIAAEFETATGHHVTLSAASTGKLYAQIVHGAPFDVFLAADSVAPASLEERGKAVRGTRFTYAVGQLVLWSRDARLSGRSGDAVLRSMQFTHLALANSRYAPYGAAGLAVLRRLGLDQALADKLVLAEDVGQAFQFAATGNADLAFVAWSQTLQASPALPGSVWHVPQNWYAPILQQAVLLMPARDSVAARAFLNYLRGEFGADLVEKFGYARLESALADAGAEPGP